MNKLRLFLIAAGSVCALAFSACNKVNDAIQVNVPLKMAEVNFTIQPAASGQHDLGTFSVYANVDSVIKAYNASLLVSSIRSVKIKSCTIAILDPAVHPDDNFTALSAARADLSSDAKPDWVTVAEVSAPPTDPSFLTLPVNEQAELKDYFKGNTFSFRLSGNLQRAIMNEVRCRANITFNIEAGL